MGRLAASAVFIIVHSGQVVMNQGISMDKFQRSHKGVGHSCNEAIDRAEKKVLVIRENGELDEF